MLVAFQRTGEERHLPDAAAHLEALLRSWGPGPSHLTGLALIGITLPSRLGPRLVDALVFTRTGVVVIAAHSPGLSPGSAERAGAGVAAAKGALAGHDGGRYVTGLVAVVPAGAREGVGERQDRVAEPGAAAVGPPGSRAVPEPDAREGVGERQDRVAEPGAAAVGPPATLAVPEPRDPVAESRSSGGAPESDGPETSQEPIPLHHPLRWHEADPFPGVAVVLADPRSLRRIIGQHNRWRTVWSADDVLDACYSLSLAHLAPPRAALLADGFPARVPAPVRLPDLPAVLPLPPEPPAAAVPDEPGPRIPAPRGHAVFPRQRPIRQVPWGLVFVLTLLVTVGVIAAVFVAQVFHGS